MSKDPREILRRSYVPPSRLINQTPAGHAHAGAGAGAAAGGFSTPTPAGNNGLGQNNGSNGYNNNAAAPSYLASSHNPAKRVRSNLGVSVSVKSGALVYRDGETTGFEDDGSESPYIRQTYSRVPPITAARIGPGMVPLVNRSNSLMPGSATRRLEAGLNGSGPASTGPTAVYAVSDLAGRAKPEKLIACQLAVSLVRRDGCRLRS